LKAAQPTALDPLAPGGVSVVVPAFDEEQGLGATLDELRQALRRCNRDFEIVVVDDGSTDGTRGILAATKDIVVIRHAETRGYGAALKAGVRAAKYPLIVVMDADGTYPAHSIPRLLERSAAADMVVGARTGERVQKAHARTAVKWCFRQFAQWITGARVPDLNSGLRAFHRPLAERYLAFLPDGFSFTTTITVASLLERRVVHFEPVDYLARLGRSKFRPLRDTARIGRQLARLGMHFVPLRTVATGAVPLLALCTVSAAYHALRFRIATPSDVAGVAAGLALLMVGARAELRARRRRGEPAAELVPARDPVS